MGILDKTFDNYLNRHGYLKKSDQPNLVTNFQTTPYVPTLDKYTDIFEYYKSKVENYPFADLSKNVPIVRNIQFKIVTNTFKEGFQILSDYVKKCKVCQAEYNTDVDECDNCGSIEFDKPNDKNKVFLEEFLKSSNINKYNLKRELKASCYDGLRYDEGMLLKQFEYKLESKTLTKKLVALQRVVPTNIFPNTSQNGVLGASYLDMAEGFCPFHRDSGAVQLQKMVCPKCGAPLLTYDYYSVYGENSKVKIPLHRDELIRIPFFEMSSRYSIVQTLWAKATSLMAIDQLINDIYVLRKFPNRALFFKTSNIDPLIEANEKNKSELMKDKNYIPMFAIGTEAEGDFVKVVDMLGSVDDLKLMELKDQYERDIVSVYNCKIDPETREILVTPDYIKELQSMFNEYVLDDLTKSFGIDDWKIILRPNLKEEEANELRLMGLKIQNASGMVNLGYSIEGFDKERKEFIFSDNPENPTGQSNFSSFSSNSRGLENTYGNLPGQDKMHSEEPKDKKE